MKQLLTMLLAAVFLLSCNSKKGDAGVAPVESHDDHAKHTEGLVLNNGAKWKADSITILNVSLLRDIVSTASQESPLKAELVAKQLEEGLNKMITECKMKGADHDALHQWLEPVMEKTKELKKISDPGNAAVVLGEIKRQLALFANYFE